MSVPPEVAWELIVVDNNSSDATKAVVAEFAQASGLRVRYVFEARQGLAHARNRGVSAARGEILAFTDDDCLVAPNWLAAIVAEFSSDLELAGIGGRVLLYDEHDLATRTRLYHERVRFSSPRQVFKLIPGCNMAFTRQAFGVIGGFDPQLGAGTIFFSAEDSDFLYRIYKQGFKMIHAPEVLVYHNHGRRAAAQIQSLRQGYLIGRGAFYCKHILQGDGDILKLAYRELSKRTKRLIKSLLHGESVKPQACAIVALIKGASMKWRRPYFHAAMKILRKAFSHSFQLHL
jgi:GT2 family glycosyltransferase